MTKRTNFEIEKTLLLEKIELYEYYINQYTAIIQKLETLEEGKKIMLKTEKKGVEVKRLYDASDIDSLNRQIDEFNKRRGTLQHRLEEMKSPDGDCARLRILNSNWMKNIIGG